MRYAGFSSLPAALGRLAQLTSLDLEFCCSLQSVDALADLTQLSSLDLRYCDALESADALSGLELLSSLGLSGCKQLRPRPPRDCMATREEVAAYQELIRSSPAAS